MSDLFEIFLASAGVLLLFALAAYRWRKGHSDRPYLWFDMVIMSTVAGFVIVLAVWILETKNDVPVDVIDRIGMVNLAND